MGGAQPKHSADTTVRYIALLGTPLFVIHGFFVMTDLVDSSVYAGPLPATIILSLWLIVGLYHYFVPVRSRADLLMRFILYHAFAVACVVFITGFMQPFAPALALLFVAANMYFGVRGIITSATFITIVAVVDTLVRLPGDDTILVNNLIGTSAILIVGASIVAISIAQDTKKNALARSRQNERLQYDRIVTIMNNLTDATFTTDQQGKIVMYNAACLNLLDTNESLRGSSIGSLFTLSTADEEMVDLFQVMLAAHTTTRRSDMTHRYKDGETIRLELTISPIKSSFAAENGAKLRQGGYIVIARDVTKEKSLEEERDEFISVVSHELRTPTTIVEGTLSNLQLLLSQPKLPAKKVLTQTVDMAHDQTLYLAKMINDLSTLSRAERGVADATEQIDVSEMLNALHQRYDASARDKKLRLDIDLGAKLGRVTASRLYLEELLQNFITNAIKYTEKGSVTIIAKKAKGKVSFSVKDSGIGISRGDQKKIFHKFYRSEDYRIRETNGTGLGLYVSAKLAHKLGTQIDVTSRLNHGSTFSFQLPAAAEDAPSGPSR